MKAKTILPSSLRKHLLSWLLIFCGVVVGAQVIAQPGEQVRLSTFRDTALILQLIDDGRSLMHSQPDSAIGLLSRALHLSRDTKFGKGKRNALLNLAQSYYQLRQYDRSILMAEALKKVSDSIQNRDARFYAYYYAGISNHRHGNYPEAFEAYTQALKFTSDTSQWKIAVYNNLGELMRINNSHDKALDYFNLAIAVNTKSGGSHDAGLMKIYANAARIYTHRGNFKEATAYYDSATAIAVRHHQPEELFYIHLGQANLFNYQGLPHRALAHIKEARKIQEEMQLVSHLNHQPDLFAGDAYMRIPDYQLAEKHYLQALEIVDSQNLNDRMLIAHKLSRIYDITGDYEKAYKFHLSSHNLLETVKNKEVQAKLNEAEIRYETAEKDKAIALQSMQLLESKRQLTRKNLWIVSIAAGAVIFALVALLFFLNYRRKRKIEAQEKEIDQLKAMMNGEEKERVRLSRELHDGVGSMLAAIKMNAGSVRSAYQQGIPVGEELDRIITMLQETSSEVRTTAHNLMPDVLTRYDLQEAVIQYIQKVNSSHDIRIDFHVPEPLRDLNKPAELLLYRMIQELIQNVLKHAEATHIEVQLLQLEEEISLMVEDNGKGMATEIADRGIEKATAYKEIAKPEAGNQQSETGNSATKRADGKPDTERAYLDSEAMDANATKSASNARESDTGYGLDNLKYRVHALQGQLIVNSRPGKGTAVSISFDREKLKKITT